MAHRCTSCGAQVDVPPDVLSTTCRFCDSPLVDVPDSGPTVDEVVPFVVEEGRARALVTAWRSQRWFAPEAIRAAGEAGRLKATFVPAYAFDAEAETMWSARVGIHWQRVETYTTVENGKTVTKTRTVTETEWFGQSGVHLRVWQDHLVSASKGLPEAEANELEPFDLGAAVPFVPERVAGIVAEHPTVPRHEADAVARDELAQLERQAIAGGFLPGDTHDSLRTDTTAHLGTPRLVLLPVWIGVLKGGDHSVRVLVNGQTGEVVGDVPWDRWKVAGAVVVGAIVLLTMVTLLVWGMS